MTQTPCPHCGADIDNDSMFCDQCGAELLKCPKCNSFRKGRFCPKCGVATVPAKDSGASRTVADPVVKPEPPKPSVPPVSPVPSGNPAYAAEPAGPRPTTIPPSARMPVPSRLVCQAMGVVLQLQPGAVIGRRLGPYTAQLATFQYISGTHARVDFDGSRWSITDIGSRNGTAVNGMPCQSFPVPLNIGDVIRFATVYDFKVE